MLAIRREVLQLPFRVPQSWLDSVVYLYKDEAAAIASDSSGGTGFLLGWPIPGRTDFTLWAVTNWHVIENGNWTLRLNRREGGFTFIDTNDQEWTRHPGSDLAVRHIAHAHDDIRFNFLAENTLLTREWLEALDIGPGDECCTVGRFVGHDGIKQNNPTARFGQISQSPNEPVVIDGIPQECFLVECRSIGGYSGSPTFVHLDPNYWRPNINSLKAPDGTLMGPGIYPCGPWLLGITFSMIPMWEQVHDKNGKVANVDYKVRINTGLMGVIPAWHLSELMLSSPVRNIRDRMKITSSGET